MDGAHGEGSGKYAAGFYPSPYPAGHQPDSATTQAYRNTYPSSTSMDLPSSSASNSPASCSGSEVVYKFAPGNQKVKPSREKIQYRLFMIQQPRRSRMVGSGEKADRRPIDPPPIAGFQAIDQSHSSPGTDLTLLRSPSFICYATLCESAVPHKEIFTIPHSRKPYVVGTRVSSIFQLRENNRSAVHGHYFVFPDLGVRVEGKYRLKLSVYEIEDMKVYFCASLLTDQFEVFSAKRFPGMKESTPLSKTFAKQGIRLRVRTKVPGLGEKQSCSRTGELSGSEDKVLNRASKARKRKSCQEQQSIETQSFEPPQPLLPILPSKFVKTSGLSLPSVEEMLRGAPAYNMLSLNDSPPGTSLRR